MRKKDVCAYLKHCFVRTAEVTSKKYRFLEYICIYISIYVYIHACFYIHVYIDIFLYTSLCISIYIYIHIFLYISIYVYPYVYRSTHTCVSMYTCLYISIQKYTYVCIYVYMSIYICTYIHMFTEIHISLHFATHSLRNPHITKCLPSPQLQRIRGRVCISQRRCVFCDEIHTLESRVCWFCKRGVYFGMRAYISQRSRVPSIAMYKREVCILQRGGVFRNELYSLEGRVCTSLRGGVFRKEQGSPPSQRTRERVRMLQCGSVFRNEIHSLEGRVCNFTTRVCISQRTRVPSSATNQGEGVYFATKEGPLNRNEWGCKEHKFVFTQRNAYFVYIYTHFYIHIWIHICCERGSKEFKSKSSVLTVKVNTDKELCIDCQTSKSFVLTVKLLFDRALWLCQYRALWLSKNSVFPQKRDLHLRKTVMYK